ncbi:precorrin-4 C(11)-methyltransferase [Aureibacter tunicatorum]|uniref:Precorrin-4 C11-methyltransferase n=1 Tax=Aureibacter tunicatorum TaxID=866807 RepID=A0AAE3XKA2_9BACT|nr:precorrin-4 C(11)-methyltransferase [Aureibacter tunicatorum]MDR6237548.1 precorrin-4 C11-methyltransferase [Aureibacter tunicatorum]BDD02582.1 precorrin-4 C(11)-methyltransferase [Aureibacter tunicatorum]
MIKKICFIAFTDQGIRLSRMLQSQFPKSVVISTRDSEYEEVSQVESIDEYLKNNFQKTDAFCFIGALGICVRKIASLLNDKREDPAVICLDEKGSFVQSVVSGHIGEANDLAKKVASITGGQAVISTASDVQDIWALDTLAQKYDWILKSDHSMNELISIFVNQKPTAVLLELKDKGTEYLEKSVPEFVDIFYTQEELDHEDYELLIVVSNKRISTNVPTLYYIPRSLCVGSGCSKELDSDIFQNRLKEEIEELGYFFESIKTLNSVDIKAQQQAYLDFEKSNNVPFQTFNNDEIDTVQVPNPSEVVMSKIGVQGVSESTAMLSAGQDKLLSEKKKIILDNGEKFTFALALDRSFERKGEIAIIGAGPGDEALITLKGKEYLQNADCVLYAGSLIPEEMTNWCKQGAVVRNSAMMTLEEQLELMTEHYQKGNSVVRLHSGDPSIYGAIQEQMSIMDELGFEYFIIPGISSFSAAAAALKSEFTVPEVVQSIILTRGEGKTPLPPSENLEEMAKHKATMCVFLSAGLAKKVQAQLLSHYDENTPVAVLYRLTWKDEEIYQGELKDLAQIIKDSGKTRTVLIIVGHAIGARKNRSLLYSPDWKHIFRTGKKFKAVN